MKEGAKLRFDIATIEGQHYMRCVQSHSIPGMIAKPNPKKKPKKDKAAAKARPVLPSKRPAAALTDRQLLSDESLGEYSESEESAAPGPREGGEEEVSDFQPDHCVSPDAEPGEDMKNKWVITHGLTNNTFNDKLWLVRDVRDDGRLLLEACVNPDQCAPIWIKPTNVEKPVAREVRATTSGNH